MWKVKEMFLGITDIGYNNFVSQGFEFTKPVLLLFCLLFYSHIVFSYAYYASEVNPLFSNYAQIAFGSKSISFPIVLKHDRNTNNIF